MMSQGRPGSTWDTRTGWKVIVRNHQQAVPTWRIMMSKDKRESLKKKVHGERPYHVCSLEHPCQGAHLEPPAAATTGAACVKAATGADAGSCPVAGLDANSESRELCAAA